MAGKGGIRPGAGRKKGSLDNKAFKAHAASIRTAAIESGELPHEFLLRVSRGEKIKWALPVDNGYIEIETPPTLDQRIDAAKAAAQFFAPRLAQIEQKTEIEIRAEILAEPLSEVEWSARYGLGTGTAGLLGTTAGTTEGAD